uniref:Uncharacterized protein n=1 Tax=Solanum lycopersicum TaxID=4081 RepID=A0A3Q7JSD4_SOLLC
MVLNKVLCAQNGGRLPMKLFLLKSSTDSSTMLPKQCVIEPLKLLCDKSKRLRLLMLQMDEGSGPSFNVGFALITSSVSPLNRLCWSDTEDSKGRLNTQDGMVPFSELYEKSSSVRFGSMPALLGSGPDRELLDNPKYSRCVKLKIEEGNGPMNLNLTGDASVCNTQLQQSSAWVDLWKNSFEKIIVTQIEHFQVWQKEKVLRESTLQISIVKINMMKLEETAIGMKIANKLTTTKVQANNMTG